MKKTAKVATAPATFADLVKVVERALKKGTQFQVVRPEGETVRLESLRLRGVTADRKFGASGVRLVCEASFLGRHGPHKVLMPRLEQAALGVSDIEMGMGDSPYEDGTVVKGMSFKVLAQALSREMLEQVEGILDTPLAKEVTVLAELASSKAYQDALLALQDAEQEAARASAQAQRLKKQLSEMTAAALKKAKPAPRKTLKTPASAKAHKTPAARKRAILRTW